MASTQHSAATAAVSRLLTEVVSWTSSKTFGEFESFTH